MMLTLMMVLMMMIEYVDCNDDDIDNVNIHDDCNNGPGERQPKPPGLQVHPWIHFCYP